MVSKNLSKKPDNYLGKLLKQLEKLGRVIKMEMNQIITLCVVAILVAIEYFKPGTLTSKK